MNRVIKNASWIIICRIIQAILALVISMITARYLGPSNYGLLNYAISITTFALPVMRLGLSSVLVQEIVSDPENEGEIIGTSLVLNFFSAIACICGINLFVIIANAGDIETILVCALYSSILLFQTFELINYWFQAKLLAKYSSIIALIAYGVVSVYKIYLLITHKSIYWFALSNSFDYLLIAIGLIFTYKRFCSHSFRFNWTLGKKLLSISKYYIISDLMVVIFAQTDRVMLKGMIDNAATGYYSAAITCAGMTQFVFAAIIDSMRPMVFESKKQSEDSYKLNLMRLFSIIAYLSIIQCTIMTLFAPIIIRLFYGVQYNASVSALQIVVWYTTFSYLGSARNIWILAEGKQKYLWQINMFGAIANIILNASLIPVLGINGAALASLITQFFTNIITGYIFKPIKGVNELLLKSFSPVFFINNVNIVIRQLKTPSSEQE